MAFSRTDQLLLQLSAPEGRRHRTYVRSTALRLALGIRHDAGGAHRVPGTRGARQVAGQGRRQLLPLRVLWSVVSVTQVRLRLALPCLLCLRACVTCRCCRQAPYRQLASQLAMSSSVRPPLLITCCAPVCLRPDSDAFLQASIPSIWDPISSHGGEDVMSYFTDANVFGDANPGEMSAVLGHAADHSNQDNHQPLYDHSCSDSEVDDSDTVSSNPDDFVDLAASFLVESG